MALKRDGRKNRAIITRFLRGETLSSIGESLALSRQRIQQILAANGVSQADRPPKPKPPKPPDGRRRFPKHGTTSKYRSGCRCDSCRAAGAQARREQASSPGHVAKHGTVSEYFNFGCRCDLCCDARSAYGRKQYSSKKEKER